MNASRVFSGSLLAGLLLCGVAIGANSATQSAPAPNAIPDFSSKGRTWVLSSGTAFLKVPGDTGPGPIVDKNFPGSAFDQQRGGARSQNRIADTTNPILKPWRPGVNAGGVPCAKNSTPPVRFTAGSSGSYS